MAEAGGYEYKEIMLEGQASAMLSALDLEGWEPVYAYAGGYDSKGTCHRLAITHVLRRPRQVDEPNRVRQNARRGK